MNQKRSRELRKLSGFVKASKLPTTVDERSHSWRERWNSDKNRWEFRPSQLAVMRYGFKDKGWAKRSTYFTVGGKVRKEIFS
jgi:hypothetical protein